MTEDFEMIEHLGDITKISGRTARPVRVIIGGFPLIWRELGNTTVWQSEIDEFCEAVTKARFG